MFLVTFIQKILYLGYIPFKHRAVERTCFTGRGSLYQGPVNVGSNPRTGQPENCRRGTFCRNPTPKDQPWPWCHSELTGEILMCRVVGCGQGKSKYAGNRGVQAKMTLNYPGGQVNN